MKGEVRKENLLEICLPQVHQIAWESCVSSGYGIGFLCSVCIWKMQDTPGACFLQLGDLWSSSALAPACSTWLLDCHGLLQVKLSIRGRVGRGKDPVGLLWSLPGQQWEIVPAGLWSLLHPHLLFYSLSSRHTVSVLHTYCPSVPAFMGPAQNAHYL